jgi:hypothetical protein
MRQPAKSDAASWKTQSDEGAAARGYQREMSTCCRRGLRSPPVRRMLERRACHTSSGDLLVHSHDDGLRDGCPLAADAFVGHRNRADA